MLIGISGGVDSAVSAYMLKKEGYEVIGVTFLLFDDFKYSLADAKKVCNTLGIKHLVVDWRKTFQKEIIDYFVTSYQNGQTPNPCIRCNEKIKYGAFLKLADDLKAEYIATGHYAKIVSWENQWAIQKLKLDKDQSYFLYRLNQEVLNRTLFPLAEMNHKEDTRNLAREAGIFVAEKKDSQEICFISDDYRAFLKNQNMSENKKGYFVDVEGHILGAHEGIWNYTIGQRKGLKLSFGEPKYVIAIRKDTQEVVLGDDRDLFVKQLHAEKVHWVFSGAKDRQKNLQIKIRYNGPCEKGHINSREDGSIDVFFDAPVRAVTPGQSVVLYDEQDLLLGGGIISSCAQVD